MTLPQTRWLRAAGFFDGFTLSKDMAIGVDNGIIAHIIPANELPDNAVVEDTDAIVTPGFFDIQINGGGNVMFNSSPNCEGLTRIAAAHRANGTTHWLPTVITDGPDVLDAACDAILECYGTLGIAGIHIEGPHIALERKGTHESQWIRPFDDHTLAHVRRLRSAGIPVLITVAPEVMQVGQVASLVDMGAVVSVGHSNANSEQTKQTMAEGAQLFTHLFNAMSQMENREPNVVGTGINSDRYCSVIVDGLHVDLDMIGLAVRARPVADRMIIVTDAMATVGGDDEFVLYGDTIKLTDGRLINAEGSLAGAHTTIREELRNMVEVVGVPLAEALRMTTTNPAALMGLTGVLGQVKVGMPAEFLLVSQDMKSLIVFNG